ncbi:MAG: cation:proton antiporter [Methanobacteriaceae archaeon]|nr:cation:proton antiporter [Methanobacteriaceae archaeon]
MELPLLRDVVVILGLTVIVLFIFQRLKIPSIVGFLLTGIIAGPSVLGLISATREVEILAEIGIILLLFTIGIEFSLDRFSKMKRSVLIGGSIQVILTFIIFFLIALQWGLSNNESIFIGLLVSLSSTAIVLKILQERGELDSLSGRTAFGILIFQDIAVVPMVLLVPIIAGQSSNIADSLLLLFIEGVGIIILTLVCAKWLIPPLLYQIARLKNRELFLLSVIVICFAVTWLTTSIGLSTALGAFLAGLIISESEYSHQALGNIIPFQDLFTSIFFISIGMLLDVNFFIQNPIIIILVAVILILIKSSIAGLVTGLLGYSFRIMVLTGLLLSQIGEFSFILAVTGLEYNLINGDIYQIFLGVSILTMALTPFIVAAAPKTADTLLKLPIPHKIKSGTYPIDQSRVIYKKDHLIIIGFGINGQNVAKAAQTAQIPYNIIEINPELIKNAKTHETSVIYGDATHEPILKKANIESARVVVVAISDPLGTRKITDIAKKLNPNTYLIVRTRYMQEMDSLYKLGADEVIPEEFETSVEIFSRVLDKYDVSPTDISKYINKIRADKYEMFRNISDNKFNLGSFDVNDSDMEISNILIKDNPEFVGKTLAEIKFEEKYNVNIILIKRDSQIITQPIETTKIKDKDSLVVIGKIEDIKYLKERISK